MENIKKTIKERANGLILVIFAVTIVAGISIGSHRAESQVAQNTTDTIQASNEGQILGETNDNSEEITNNPEGVNQNAEVDNNENTNQEEEQEKEIVENKSRCDDLSRLLKKYCGKNYNVKKCRNYLLETKDLVKKDDQCKKLYKKYHFVPKKVENKDNSSSSNSNTSGGSSEVKEEATLVINYAGSKADDKYTVVIEPGITVMGMMDRAKSGGLSYDESKEWAGYIMEINGIREDGSKSMYWMFYVNGVMSFDKGASEKEVKAGDKVEWIYTKF